MNVNADFEQRVLLHTDELPWLASPMAGVERRMLDRIGDEVARATSLVRYASGSRFSPHVHGGGEEFLVLEGVFQDEHGDYPAGSYVRNPPTSRHTPRSDDGCIIFVKLWQFDPDDRTQVRADLDKVQTVAAAERPGVSVQPLFEDALETVRVEHWAPGATVALDVDHGAEWLVLEGSATESGEELRQRGWLRMPAGARLDAVAGDEGARVFLKLHRRPRVLPVRAPDGEANTGAA